jgi:hypothetical protein
VVHFGFWKIIHSEKNPFKIKSKKEQKNPCINARIRTSTEIGKEGAGIFIFLNIVCNLPSVRKNQNKLV